MSRGVINVLAVAVVVLLAGATFRAKTDAAADRKRLEALRAERAEAERTLSLLRAELANLEEPRRLSVLAERELGLKPIDALSLVGFDEAALLLEAPDALIADADAAEPAPFVAQASAEAAPQ